MEGRWISPEDVAERRRIALLGGILRRKLFSGTPAIGETVRIDGVKFTVVGSMDTKFSDSNCFTSDDESVFIPYTTAGDLWDARYASVMLFEPIAPNFEADAMQQFRAAIASRQHFSPNDKRAITMFGRSEEHTSELQSPCNLVCRLLLEQKQMNANASIPSRY